MSVDRDPLRPEHARLVELRLEGVTVDACAARLSIDRATAYRWLTRPDVKAALAEGQAAGRDVAAGILAGLAPRAADVLGELLDAEDPHVRVRAAREILDRVGIVRPPALEEDETTIAVSDDGATVYLDGATYRRADE